MAGERGTAGSPAGSNEMIDVKKARVLYRVCATSLAKFGKFGKFVSRPLAADRQRSRVVSRGCGRRDICVRSPDRAARLVAGQAPASADDFPDAEPRVHLRGEEGGGANLR